MSETAATVRGRLRPLEAGDLPAVVRIDAQHADPDQRGVRKRAYWKRVFAEFVEGGRGAARRARGRVALGLEADGRLLGFVFAEVRAFEFGSEACGWVFAVGVDRSALREGVASRLLEAVHRRLRAAGVRTVRTMVRRRDVPVLSFFRRRGYAGGPFAQLERDLEATT